ncbi:MAG: hypothetical protein KTR26_18455 [Flammeovirgaceae bacterium]|nr:hypothetical protein [Flammeovirgaceae bacterium]
MDDNKATVYLGGISSENDWREFVIPQLQINHVDPFQLNAVEGIQEKLFKLKDDCNFIFYLFRPGMNEFLCVPELIDDSNKFSEKTVYVANFENKDKIFTNHQKKSLEAIGKMVERNGGRWFKTLEEAIVFLNSYI